MRIVRGYVISVGWLLMAGCSTAAPPPSPASIHVIGTDYAFDMPDSVGAGPTVITFENRGQQRHEAILVRIKPGVTAREFADSLASGANVRVLRATGSAVLFADPGTRNALVSVRVEFTRGEQWALYCQFADSAGAPTHKQLGMFKLVAVR